MRPKILDAGWGWRKGNLGEGAADGGSPSCPSAGGKERQRQETQAVMAAAVVEGIPAWRRRMEERPGRGRRVPPGVLCALVPQRPCGFHA